MAGEDQIAGLARRLRELTDGTPERDEWLDRIAAEIREGRYTVDSEALADILIEEADRRGPKAQRLK